MRPRFVGQLGLADAVSAANAAVGFLAVVALPGAPGLAARLVLVAAIADGLDGLVARWRGGTEAGEYLDSLADVASFGVAPAALVAAVAAGGLDLGSLPGAGGGMDPTVRGALAVAVPAAFVVAAVLRLGLYTAHDVGDHYTEGVQTTLAATVIAAAVLAGAPAWAVLAASGAFAYLMLTTVEYPDLHRRDAVVMGAVQATAVLAPDAMSGLFPAALLAWALAYLVLAPRFYWR